MLHLGNSIILLFKRENYTNTILTFYRQISYTKIFQPCYIIQIWKRHFYIFIDDQHNFNFLSANLIHKNSSPISNSKKVKKSIIITIARKITVSPYRRISYLKVTPYNSRLHYSATTRSSRTFPRGFTLIQIRFQRAPPLSTRGIESQPRAIPRFPLEKQRERQRTSGDPRTRAARMSSSLFALARVLRYVAASLLLAASLFYHTLLFTSHKGRLGEGGDGRLTTRSLNRLERGRRCGVGNFRRQAAR